MIRLPTTTYNPLLIIDSYETDRMYQYPDDAAELSSYLSFRRTMPSITPSDERAGFVPRNDDPRMLFFGVRYIVETFFAKKITHEFIDEAVSFFSTHGPGFTPYPFPEAEFRRVVDEFNGIPPIKVEALPGGTVIRKGTALVQLTCAIKGLVGLVTWYEDVILHNWYGSAIATRSMRTMDDLITAFDLSVDDDARWKLTSRHHNFGGRAATCCEQMILGDLAHTLAGHEGTDIVLGAFYAQKMNNGVPLNTSLPATAHCSTSSHRHERDMVENMVSRYGNVPFVTVIDTNDDQKFLDNILPEFAPEVIKQGGFHVLRPDSGDMIDSVLRALHGAEAAYGIEKVNDKGYKVLRQSAVINGNGMSPAAISVLYYAVMQAGYSAENLAIGEGGKLMQVDLNRDMISAGFKANHIKFDDGEVKNAMKCPKDAKGKWSYPGQIAVKNGVVYPKAEVADEDNQFVVYFDGANGGLTDNQDVMGDMIERAKTEWSTALATWSSDVMSDSLIELQQSTADKLHN